MYRQFYWSFFQFRTIYHYNTTTFNVSNKASIRYNFLPVILTPFKDNQNTFAHGKVFTD